MTETWEAVTCERFPTLAAVTVERSSKRHSRYVSLSMKFRAPHPTVFHSMRGPIALDADVDVGYDRLLVLAGDFTVKNIVVIGPSAFVSLTARSGAVEFVDRLRLAIRRARRTTAAALVGGN